MGKQREQKYRTAIYCRLSDEDYEKKREVSESIENVENTANNDLMILGTLLDRTR